MQNLATTNPVMFQDIINKFMGEVHKYMYGTNSNNKNITYMSTDDDHRRRILLDNICRHGDYDTLWYLIQGHKQQHETPLIDDDSIIDEFSSTSVASSPSSPTKRGSHLTVSLFNMQNKSTGRSPFHYLVRFGYLDMLQCLFDWQERLVLDAEQNKQTLSIYQSLNYRTYSVCSWNILHDVAKNGRMDVLELLLNKVSGDVILDLLCQQNTFGSTPIQLSMVHEHLGITDKLIHFYHMKQYIEWSKYLEMLSKVNHLNRNILQVAVEKKHMALSDTIFDACRCAEKQIIAHGNQQQRQQVQQNFSFLKLLQSTDNLGAQLFHFSCVQKNDNMFAKLFKFLQFGHYLDSTYNGTSGTFAPAIMRLLINVDAVGNTPFHYAFGSNSKFSTILLVRYFFLTAFNRQQARSAVMNSSYSQQLKELQDQRKGSRNPINLPNKKGESPMFVACRKSCFETVRYLLLCTDVHEQELLAKIADSVDEKDIDLNFLQLLMCKNPDQTQFLEKCIRGIHASRDTLLDKRDRSPYNETNATILDEIFEEFSKYKQKIPA